MEVLSAAEMQNCDRVTTERFGVPSLTLMRAASAAVADFALMQFPNARRVLVLCGRGNNGGDGMMAARLLSDAGLDVTTLLLGAPDALAGDAATAWMELTLPVHGRVFVVANADELERHNDTLDADLILDAVLGTGFKPPLSGLALAALEWAQKSRAAFLAVDIPSGWPSDATSSMVESPVFPADAVVTFTSPKPAHVFGQLTRRWDQPVAVAPIGSPDAAMISEERLSWAGASLELIQRPRATNSNKGKFGHVLAVGGSFGPGGGKAGAAAMVGMGALRAGAGLVTVAVPEPAMIPVASLAPELMTWSLAATVEGQISQKNLSAKQIAALTAGKTVLAIGPGMGQSAETTEFAIGLLTAAKMPAVVDADALNILAAQPEVLPRLAKERVLVLTPHPGEMARLAGVFTDEVQADRLEIARNFAQRMGVILVLKGARTLIARPDGQVAVNTSGNPGMAKGGSGDLLTGIIAGLLAQHPKDPAHAVEAAVYLHGLAADFAVREGDEHTLLATDSLRYLSRAFRFQGFRFGKDGPNRYVWLQGAVSCCEPQRRVTSD
jgi:NAD(P)H-hydrate epimerase